MNKLIDLITKSEEDTGFIIAMSEDHHQFWQIKSLSLPFVLLRSGFIPHRALLKDPRLNLYMNNCGFSTVLQAAYFGVPILGLPQDND